MRTVNSTPMPSDIHRTRGSMDGFGPNRSQAVMNATPITLRNDSMVSTSQCAAAMILTSTSETPRTIAAATPGVEETTERKAKDKKTTEKEAAGGHTPAGAAPEP